MSTDVPRQNKSSTFFLTNYFKCSQKIFKIKMGSCEKGCLIFLFQFQNCGATFPSIPSIASSIEYNIKTVRKALRNLEDNFHFIKTTPCKGNSNTYEILYDNIEYAYEEALIEEKKTKIYLVPPLPKTVPVPKSTLVSTPPKIGTTTPPKNGMGVLPNMGVVPLPKMVPDNNESKITTYNDDDDKAQRAEIPPSSPQRKTVQQPVVRNRKLSSTELCDRFKKIIYQNGKPTSWIKFELFSKVELTEAECQNIIDYAITNQKHIQQYDLNSEDDVLNAILDMQDRMNRKPEKEYNPTQVTQVEFENNLLKKGFKIDYN